MVPDESRAGPTPSRKAGRKVRNNILEKERKKDINNEEFDPGSG